MYRWCGMSVWLGEAIVNSSIAVPPFLRSCWCSLQWVGQRHNSTFTAAFAEKKVATRSFVLHSIVVGSCWPHSGLGSQLP